MKTLYLDCGMGAAGDMLTAALYELLPEKEDFVRTMNGLGLPGVEIRPEQAEKCGILGTHMAVTVEGLEEDDHLHEHPHHHGMPEVRKILGSLAVPEQVRQDVLAVYTLIAEAESHAHGLPVEQIHFHEVGTLDAIADVTAVCLLIHLLKPDRILASPIHVGSGTVRCAHGILPVPAPATAFILREVPIYGGSIESELCTPTGAALLKHFAEDFVPMPMMQVQAIGYGMGRKDFPRANCLRAFLGKTEGTGEQVLELSCNVDDMTGEAAGFALERLLEAGALDAWTQAIGMKKSRPGLLISAICREKDREKLVEAFLKHTTTLGVRETICRRHTLERSFGEVETPYGTIRRKDSRGYGVSRSKYEYEDLARIAREQDLSLAQVQALAMKAEKE